jgi:Domain of unknown function (DUF1707)
VDRNPDLRAADADRQAVADRLREALNEGRLDLGEYDERLQKAYAARTYGELDGLLTDLPAVTPPARQQLSTVPAAPGSRQRVSGRLLAIWGSWATTSFVCFTIWLLTSPGGYPWPLWVAAPWGAVLLARTIMAFASGDPEGHLAAEEREHLQRKERDRQRREERRQRRRDRGY